MKKRFNRIIAFVLAVICVFSISVPAVFADDALPEETTAAETVTEKAYDPSNQGKDEYPLPEHPTIDDVWKYVTNGTGKNSDIDWTKLPKAMLSIFASFRFLEWIFGIISKFFK